MPALSILASPARLTAPRTLRMGCTGVHPRYTPRTPSGRSPPLLAFHLYAVPTSKAFQRHPGPHTPPPSGGRLQPPDGGANLTRATTAPSTPRNPSRQHSNPQPGAPAERQGTQHQHLTPARRPLSTEAMAQERTAGPTRAPRRWHRSKRPHAGAHRPGASPEPGTRTPPQPSRAPRQNSTLGPGAGTSSRNPPTASQGQPRARPRNRSTAQKGRHHSPGQPTTCRVWPNITPHQRLTQSHGQHQPATLPAPG